MSPQQSRTGKIAIDSRFAKRLMRNRTYKACAREIYAQVTFCVESILLRYLKDGWIAHNKSKNGKTILHHPQGDLLTNHTINEILNMVHTNTIDLDIAAFRLKIFPMSVLKSCLNFNNDQPVTFVDGPNLDKAIQHHKITTEGLKKAKETLHAVFSEWDGAFCHKIDEKNVQIHALNGVLCDIEVSGKNQVTIHNACFMAYSHPAAILTPILEDEEDDDFFH